jgi:hypothetical protein
MQCSRMKNAFETRTRYLCAMMVMLLKLVEHDVRLISVD